MRLVFKKDEESQISVFQNVDGREQDFSYVDMIKALIKSRKMGDPEIAEGFTEAEIKSINSIKNCAEDHGRKPMGESAFEVL